jgi:hypothetical protein
VRIYHTRHRVHGTTDREHINASPPEPGARPGAVNWMNGAAWVTWYSPDAQPIDPEATT